VNKFLINLVYTIHEVNIFTPMLRYGIVSEFSAQKGKAKVIFLDDNIVTDWLPIVYKRTKGDKEFDALSVKEHVACLMDENSESGVILGAIYSGADPTSSNAGSDVWGREFEDGTVIKYDKAAHKLAIYISGSGAKVEVVGDLSVTGKIEATGNIESSGDVKSATVSLTTHVHAVTTAPGTSAPPTPAP